MSPRLVLFALLPLLSVCPSMGVVAGELPREGDARYTHTLVGTYANVLKVGDRSLIISEQHGVSLNDDGGVIFNETGTQCISLEEVTASGRHATGGCTFTDLDGDQIMLTLDRAGSSGNATLVSGTGKWVGISGGGPYTHHLVKADDKMLRVVVNARIHWKLK